MIDRTVTKVVTEVRTGSARSSNSPIGRFSVATAVFLAMGLQLDASMAMKLEWVLNARDLHQSLS
jgi:hypothetical protein